VNVVISKVIIPYYYIIILITEYESGWKMLAAGDTEHMPGNTFILND
jgi:hypothetical protein